MIPTIFLVLAQASLALVMFCSGLIVALVNIGMGGKGAPHIGGPVFRKDARGPLDLSVYLWRGRSPHRFVNTLLIANRIFAVTAVAAGATYVVAAVVFATPH